MKSSLKAVFGKALWVGFGCLYDERSVQVGRSQLHFPFSHGVAPGRPLGLPPTDSDNGLHCPHDHHDNGILYKGGRRQ